MKQQPPAITSLPVAPAEERRGRMLRYILAMSVRVLCLLICFVVPGWWRVLPLVAAAVLPAIAVVLANAVSRAPGAAVAAPVPRELSQGVVDGDATHGGHR